MGEGVNAGPNLRNTALPGRRAVLRSFRRSARCWLALQALAGRCSGKGHSVTGRNRARHERPCARISSTAAPRRPATRCRRARTSSSMSSVRYSSQRWMSSAWSVIFERSRPYLASDDLRIVGHGKAGFIVDDAGGHTSDGPSPNTAIGGTPVPSVAVGGGNLPPGRSGRLRKYFCSSGRRAEGHFFAHMRQHRIGQDKYRRPIFFRQIKSPGRF